MGSPIIPDYGDIPEDDTAEPDDIGVEHVLPPEDEEQ